MSHGGIWVELKSPGSPQRLELNWYPPGSRFHTRYRKGYAFAFVSDPDGIWIELLGRVRESRSKDPE